MRGIAVTKTNRMAGLAKLYREIAKSGRLLMLLAVMVAVFAGCGLLPRSGNKHDVPEFQTPREQAEVADLQYSRARQSLDPEVRQVELEKTAAALEMLVRKFPADRVYTPAAMVTLGDVYYEIGDKNKASEVYRRAIREYSDIEDVHAFSLFGLAQSLGDLGSHTEEKEVYRRLVETYADSENPKILQRVAIAERRRKKVD